MAIVTRTLPAISTSYLVFGALAQAFFFSITGVSQWVHDFYDSSAIESCAAVAWAFVLNRFPVAILLGVILAWGVSKSMRCSVILGLAVLIPVVIESVMTLPATLDWSPIGRRQISMLAGLLGPAIAAGTITGVISCRFLLPDTKGERSDRPRSRPSA